MILSIIISKLVAFVLHILGKGATTLPGKVALSLKYNILNHLSNGVKIICVTGTNGKTTTCALIEQGLKAAEKSYFINKSGANMITGVATAFVVNSNLFGKCKKEFAVLECDENSLPEISRYIDAQVLVVTNIFRDQLDRYGEVQTTLSKIQEGIDNMPQTNLIINADCPLTFSLCNDNSMTFGINASLDISAVSDNRFCPKCSAGLRYRSVVYSQLGDFYCPRCGYRRKKPDFSVNELFDVGEYGSSFSLNGEYVSISLGGAYNIYNFLSAAAVLDYFDIDFKPLRFFNGAFGRMEKFVFNDKKILLMLVKNPVGYASCISYAVNLQGKYNLVFALNDNGADGRDVSWIWDVSFKPLLPKCNSVTTMGVRSYDMALRLKYDGIKVNSVINGEQYSQLVRNIKRLDEDFIIFANYTSMMNMRHILINEFGGAEFWQ